jgi:hypothetical protein
MGETATRPSDYWIAPALEATLILIVALCGWLAHQPLVFASLGPTAYELVETPERRSSRPYNIIVGNAVALVAAYAALWITHAWAAPGVSAGGVPLARAWAAALAALLTVLFTLALKSTQPAALSTTLLVSLGVMQTVRDGIFIMTVVVCMALLGIPIRRWRQSQRQAVE